MTDPVPHPTGWQAMADAPRDFGGDPLLVAVLDAGGKRRRTLLARWDGRDWLTVPGTWVVRPYAWTRAPAPPEPTYAE